MASIVVLFLLLILHLGEGAQFSPPHPDQINSSSTISSNNTSWSSPSGFFHFGFYEQEIGYRIGIWLVVNTSKIVVWTAKRDHPPLTSKATLSLADVGKLVLDDAAVPVHSASMKDQGNFVLYNQSSEPIWESFKNPTDTLLGGQVLPSGTALLSSVSESNRSSGRFHLSMQLDGNLVLYPADSENTGNDAYWISDTARAIQPVAKYHLSVDGDCGALAILDDTSFDVVKTLYNDSSSSLAKCKNGKSKIYRAIMDANGMLKLYFHCLGGDNTTSAILNDELWTSIENNNPCEVKGFCGLNSYCTFTDSIPSCLCIPGAEPDKKTLGCFRNYTDGGCVGIDGKENRALYAMDKIEGLKSYDVPYSNPLVNSMEECRDFCLSDCNCGATMFRTEDGGCLNYRLPLRYLTRINKYTDSSSEYSTAFFKVGQAITDSINKKPNPPGHSKSFSIEILALALTLVIFSCLLIAISCFYVFKIRLLKYQILRDVKGQFEFNIGDGDQELTLRVFSYSELKRATNGFKEELGRGAFGTVYKGSLNKGRKLIAVKRLEKFIEEGERQFQAEMRAIGRTNHKNLVRLMGYCAQDSKRLLVYEYMSNGSLADLLFRQEQRPYWEERVRIAIDVARGIHYLHEECKTPIIHCDVKPHNILMDDFMTAKISDFGLAKLLMPDQTRTFTVVRGTRGYLAPEWQQNVPITVKADVYSFGIVLLEILCCRRNIEVNVSNPEEIILSRWAYKCFEGRELSKLVVGEEVDRKTLEMMVKVGLWCIQDEPILRPSMKSVVLMLEGITDIAAPPCPTSASMQSMSYLCT